MEAIYSHFLHMPESNPILLSYFGFRIFTGFWGMMWGPTDKIEAIEKKVGGNKVGSTCKVLPILSAINKLIRGWRKTEFA